MVCMHLLCRRYLMRSQLEFKKSTTITERVLDRSSQNMMPLARAIFFVLGLRAIFLFIDTFWTCSLHKEIGLTRFVPGYMLDSSAVCVYGDHFQRRCHTDISWASQAKERAIKKSLLMILKQLVYNDVHVRDAPVLLLLVQ